jgi:hypothetical protein
MKRFIVLGLGFTLGGFHLAGKVMSDTSSSLEGYLVNKVDPSISSKDAINLRKAQTRLIQKEARDAAVKSARYLGSGLSEIRLRTSKASALVMQRFGSSSEEISVTDVSS